MPKDALNRSIVTSRLASSILYFLSICSCFSGEYRLMAAVAPAIRAARSSSLVGLGECSFIWKLSHGIPLEQTLGLVQLRQAEATEQAIDKLWAVTVARWCISAACRTVGRPSRCAPASLTSRIWSWGRTEILPSNLPGNPNHRYNLLPHMPPRLHIQPVWVYTRKPTRKRARSRLLYALLAVAVVAAGLFWRSGIIPLPGWLSNYGGDALWAVMVFLGISFLLPRASTLTVALLALGVAWSVEFSQLYRAPWIDAVRATIPGKLVLGNTFHWLDLIAYAVGVALGAWVEWRWRR